MDYNYYGHYNQLNNFAAASMFCGTASLIMCCTGILSVPVGALGILFAILSKRKDKPMHHMSKTGIALSIVGIILGLVMLIYSMYLVATDPEYQKMYLNILQNYSQYYEGYGL